MLRSRIAEAKPAQIAYRREDLDRFAAMIWSLARRFAQTPAEATRLFNEIHDELCRSADELIFPNLIDASTVATIARQRLARHAAATHRRAPAPAVAQEQPSRDAAPLSESQQAALCLGFSAPGCKGPAQAAGVRKRPGLERLRAELEVADTLSRQRSRG